MTKKKEIIRRIEALTDEQFEMLLALFMQTQKTTQKGQLYGT